MLSPQTSYHYNQSVGTVAKLEVIRIIAHLTVGIFIVGENSPQTGFEGLRLLLSSHSSVHGLSCVYDMLSKSFGEG